MAKFDVVDRNGKKVSEIELSDAVFGITPNEKAVHIAVVNFLANQRQGTQNTKIRKEVSGGSVLRAGNSSYTNRSRVLKQNLNRDFFAKSRIYIQFPNSIISTYP